MERDKRVALLIVMEMVNEKRADIKRDGIGCVCEEGGIVSSKFIVKKDENKTKKTFIVRSTGFQKSHHAKIAPL